jgi:hypothetical protein
MTKFADLDELEIQKLTQEMSTLKYKLAQYEEILKANGLLENPPTITDAEQIAIDQISRLKRVSDEGLSFDTETAKNYETFVKTLMLAKGKAPVEEKKVKKAQSKDVGTLLKIAQRKPSNE